MDINKAYLYQKGGNNNTSIIRTRLHDRISMYDLDYPTQGNHTITGMHQDSSVSINITCWEWR